MSTSTLSRKSARVHSHVVPPMTSASPAWIALSTCDASSVGRGVRTGEDFLRVRLLRDKERPAEFILFGDLVEEVADHRVRVRGYAHPSPSANEIADLLGSRVGLPTSRGPLDRKVAVNEGKSETAASIDGFLVGQSQAARRNATHSGRSPQKEVEFRPATPLGLAERGDLGCEIAKAGPVVVRFDGAGLH